MVNKSRTRENSTGGVRDQGYWKSTVWIRTITVTNCFVIESFPDNLPGLVSASSKFRPFSGGQGTSISESVLVMDVFITLFERRYRNYGGQGGLCSGSRLLTETLMVSLMQ